MNSNLKLIVLDNIEQLGITTDEILKGLEHTTDSSIIPITRDCFNNGEGKIRINGTVCDQDIYIMCDVAVFQKRRDLNKVVDGKNPNVEHVYLGTEVKNKNIVVVDDLIASDSSMLEVGKYLKMRGAGEVYLVATFALFTDGIDKFIDLYQKGLFDKLYTTNLSYVPDTIKNEVCYKKLIVHQGQRILFTLFIIKVH